MYDKRKPAVGDKVTIKATVVDVLDNGTVVVQTDPVERPGHEESGGFTRRISLHPEEV